MTITEARTWCRNCASDADPTRYSDVEVDQAIQLAGDEFCRRTRAIRVVTDITITEGDSTPSIAAAVTAGFLPERFIDLLLPGSITIPVAIDYAEQNIYATEDTSDGTPATVAFIDATTMSLWPVPDADYTGKLRWWDDFTTWTPGGSGATTLNLADPYLKPVLTFGAPAVLKAPSKEQAFGTTAWQQFEKYIQQFKGAGSVGPRVIHRERLRD